MVNTIFEGDPIRDTKSKSSLPPSTAPNDVYPSKKQQSPSLFTISVKTIDWSQLHDVEYFTRGGSSIIHTAFYDGKEVIVKVVHPEHENDEGYKNDIENELNILSTLDHNHILKVYGAGYKRGKRFLVLERLDSCLSDIADSNLCNRKSKFWKKKDGGSSFSLKDGIKHVRSIADAMQYCHDLAIPGCMLLHRDLKPGNIGFASDGDLKLFDFGLARMLENASSYSDRTYAMSGKTGSLRYMAPEVVNNEPYNFKVDVYSFGVIFWEILSGKKSFQGTTEEQFLLSVIADNKRPTLDKAWPKKVIDLMEKCWDVDMSRRPTFTKIIQVLDSVLIDLDRKEVISGDKRSTLTRRNSMPARLVFKRLQKFDRRNSNEKD